MYHSNMDLLIPLSWWVSWPLWHVKPCKLAHSCGTIFPTRWKIIRRPPIPNSHAAGSATIQHWLFSPYLLTQRAERPVVWYSNRPSYLEHYVYTRFLSMAPEKVLPSGSGRPWGTCQPHISPTTHLNYLIFCLSFLACVTTFLIPLYFFLRYLLSSSSRFTHFFVVYIVIFWTPKLAPLHDILLYMMCSHECSCRSTLCAVRNNVERIAQFCLPPSAYILDWIRSVKGVTQNGVNELWKN